MHAAGIETGRSLLPEEDNVFYTVARGPVPRDRPEEIETGRSLLPKEGNAFYTVARGPVPRDRSRYEKNVSGSLQVRRTLMSIVLGDLKSSKVL